MRIFRQAFVLLLLSGAASLAVSAQDGGVKGKVRNTRGDGIGGATVTARLKGEDVKTVKTDAKGNFQMTGLASGVYNFVFERSGFASGVKYDVEVKSGKTQDLGDRLILMVDQGALVIINGSVYNQDGRSITGARVEVERVNADGTTKRLTTSYTNVSGEFTLRQPEGTTKYRVTATVKGVSASKEVTVEGAGVYRLAITLTLPKENEN